MLTVKKQLAAFGLLLLVALPLFFSVGIFVKQQLLQQQRRQRFETEPLETVTLKATSVDWVKAGKEIQIDGKLFDIKSFEIKGSNIVFTGFFDSKEEKLLRHARAIEQQKNKSDNPLSQYVAKFIFLPNYKEHITFSIQNSWQFIVSSFPFYSESISNISYPAVAPPPKYC